MESDAASNSAASTPPRRWRLRFSLRTLVFVIPVLAIFLTWIGNEVKRCEQDQAAAHALWSRPGSLVGCAGGEWNLSPFRPGEVLGGRLYSPYTHIEIASNVGLTHDDWDAAGKMLALQYLGVYDYEGPDDGKTFAQIPSLTDLSLESSRLTPNDLRQIGQLQHLRSFFCDNTFVIDETPILDDAPAQFPHFASEEIRTYLPHWRVEASQQETPSSKLPPLELAPGSWPHLETLELSGVQIPRDSLEAISQLETLQQLSINACDFDVRSLDCLEKLPLLWHLSLSHSAWNTPDQEANIDEQVLTHWGRMKNLSSLELYRVWLNDFGGAGENLTGRWPQLETLTLSDVGISRQAGREIAAMPNLTSVTFTRDVIDPRPLGELGDAQNLVFLTFLGQGPDASALERISRASNLQGLVVSGWRIDDEAMRHIAGMNQLTELSLLDTKVTDAGFALLKSHPRLRRINVRGDSFNYRALTSLATLPNISFGECTIDVPGFNPVITEELQKVQDRSGDVIAYLKRKRLLADESNRTEFFP